MRVQHCDIRAVSHSCDVFLPETFWLSLYHLISRGGSLVLVVVWLDHFHPEIWQKNSQLGKTWKSKCISWTEHLRVSSLVDGVPSCWHGYTTQTSLQSINLGVRVFSSDLHAVDFHNLSFSFTSSLMLLRKSTAWKYPCWALPTQAWHPWSTIFIWNISIVNFEFHL